MSPSGLGAALAFDPGCWPIPHPHASPKPVLPWIDVRPGVGASISSTWTLSSALRGHLPAACVKPGWWCGPFPMLGSPNMEVSGVPGAELGVSQAWPHQSSHSCKMWMLISPFHCHRNCSMSRACPLTPE